MFTSHFDRYLHKLLKIIGDEFDQVVTQEIKVNGVMTRESHKKWELCTSHTCRRPEYERTVLNLTI